MRWRGVIWRTLGGGPSGTLGTSPSGVSIGRPSSPRTTSGGGAGSGSGGGGGGGGRLSGPDWQSMAVGGHQRGGGRLDGGRGGDDERFVEVELNPFSAPVAMAGNSDSRR